MCLLRVLFFFIRHLFTASLNFSMKSILYFLFKFRDSFFRCISSFLFMEIYASIKKKKKRPTNEIFKNDKLFIGSFTSFALSLYPRPQSTCSTSNGSKRSRSLLAITTWRWHADPWSPANPICCIFWADVVLSSCYKHSPFKSSFHMEKGAIKWLFLRLCKSILCINDTDKKYLIW